MPELVQVIYIAMTILHRFKRKSLFIFTETYPDKSGTFKSDTEIPSNPRGLIEVENLIAAHQKQETE